MVIYNIKTKDNYDNALASYDTGNKRDNIEIRPKMGTGSYTECVYSISDSGLVYPVNTCRVKTDAPNGSQPNYDTIINGIELRKT
jgi:hypothetical protein